MPTGRHSVPQLQQVQLKRIILCDSRSPVHAPDKCGENISPYVEACALAQFYMRKKGTMEEHKGIHIDQDIEHNKRSHKRRIFGMWMFALFLLLVMAGLTGHGLLSDKKMTDPVTGETLETQKYIRYESPVDLIVHANTSASEAGDSLFDISLPSSYLENFTIESILPQPEITESSNDRMVFRFRISKGASQQLVIFHMRADKMLRHVTGEMILESKGKFFLSHYIYP